MAWVIRIAAELREAKQLTLVNKHRLADQHTRLYGKRWELGIGETLLALAEERRANDIVENFLHVLSRETNDTPMDVEVLVEGEKKIDVVTMTARLR
jgi:hypothetical protein